MLARFVGTRIQLRRAGRFLASAIESGETDFGRLKTELEALSEEPAPDEAKAFFSRFPSFATDANRSQFESFCCDSSTNLRLLKQLLVNEINAFQYAGKQPPTQQETINWLKLTREKYAKQIAWLEEGPFKNPFKKDTERTK